MSNTRDLQGVSNYEGSIPGVAKVIRDHGRRFEGGS